MKFIQKMMQRKITKSAMVDDSKDSDIPMPPLSRATSGGSEISDTSSCNSQQSADANAANLKTVRRHFKKLNAHDIEAVRKLHTEDCMWYFFDQNGDLVHEIQVEDFVHTMTSTWASFPDLKFRCHTLKLGDEEDTVMLSNGVATGTHTGEAYGFGPFEPVEPSNRTISLDREDAKIFLRNGKICKYECHAKGEMTGPMGLYTLAGGYPVL